jgi:hypothetical protein
VGFEPILSVSKDFPGQDFFNKFKDFPGFSRTVETLSFAVAYIRERQGPK